MRTELGVRNQLAFGSLLKQDIDTGGGRQTVCRMAPTHQDAGPRSRNTRQIAQRYDCAPPHTQHVATAAGRQLSQPLIARALCPSCLAEGQRVSVILALETEPTPPWSDVS